MFRIFGAGIQKSQEYRHLDNFAAIGSHITREYGLSKAEVHLLPDILYGHSVEEISVKHFLSRETVKTHIAHILKRPIRKIGWTL